MDDVINRQAAIDALDKEYRCTDQPDDFLDFLWNVINPNEMQGYLNMYLSGEEKTKQLEIIYCKDCVNAEERGCALFCGFWTRYTANKGYCFKAERRGK